MVERQVTSHRSFFIIFTKQTSSPHSWKQKVWVNASPHTGLPHFRSLVCVGYIIHQRTVVGEWLEVDVRWTWGGRRGEEPNCKSNALDHPFKVSYCSSGLQTLAWSKLLVFTSRKLAFWVLLVLFWMSALLPTSTSHPLTSWMSLGHKST